MADVQIAREREPGEDDEERPRPLYPNSASVPTFPVDALPGWLAEYVRQVATSTQTPVDLAGTLSLAALACACAGRVRVRVRADWTEPVNLFVVIALPPANGKSAVFKLLTQPIVDYEDELRLSMEGVVRACQAKLKAEQRRLERLQELAAKAESTEERERLVAECAALASKLLELERETPRVPKLVCDDVTAERLQSLLADHGRIAVLSAEGGAFELMAGRYGNGPNFEVYLKGHSGDRLVVDRQSRPSETVPHPALTLGLTVQVEQLRGLDERPSFRARGLLGRFLYSIPASTLGRRDMDPPPIDAQTRSRYHEEVRRLLARTAPPAALAELSLSSEAASAFMEFRRQLEPRLGEDGDLAGMTDWSGKLPGAVARCAGLLASANGDANVSRSTMQGAIKLGAYFLGHARAAFSEMGADPQLVRAEVILRWIRRRGITEFCRADCWRDLRNNGAFGSPEALDAPLAILEERGWVTSTKPERAPGKPGPTPTRRYAVHRAAHDGSARH